MEEQIRAESTTPLEQQKFLRSIVERMILSKLRIETLISKYRTNLKTLREHNIDENELIQTLLAKYNGDATNVDIVNTKKRFESNKEHLVWIEMRIAQLELIHNDTIDDLQAHVRELADIEISLGNFIAHIFALRDNVKVDKKNASILQFSPNGSVEIAISTSRDSWKDSSQLSLTKKEG